KILKSLIDPKFLDPKSVIAFLKSILQFKEVKSLLTGLLATFHIQLIYICPHEFSHFEPHYPQEIKKMVLKFDEARGFEQCINDFASFDFNFERIFNNVGHGDIINDIFDKHFFKANNSGVITLIDVVTIYHHYSVSALFKTKKKIGMDEEYKFFNKKMVENILSKNCLINLKNRLYKLADIKECKVKMFLLEEISFSIQINFHAD
ncbi:MAG: hypothetical protein MHPSP_001597, partial [Paramarteilia canceri]